MSPLLKSFFLAAIAYSLGPVAYSLGRNDFLSEGIWAVGLNTSSECKEDNPHVYDGSLDKDSIPKNDSIPAKNLRWVPRTGMIELGGVYGRQAFTLENSVPLNGYAKGTVGFDFFGVPFGLTFDLGTDQPVRGQRNSIRLQFDAARISDKERMTVLRELHAGNMKLDSLEIVRSGLLRKVLGQESRIHALKTQGNVQGFQTVVEDDQPTQMIDIDPIGSTDNTLDSLITVEGPLNMTDSLVQMEGDLDRTKEELERIESLVSEQKDAIQRMNALVNAKHGKHGLISDIAKGIQTFEIGTCTPNSSEFLINGGNLQGVSFEFAHKELYLAFAHGKTFDDTWQNNDPVARDLQQLNQSLFFSDARDLNPRKLTAIRTGVGKPTGSHIHVGYLNGARDDLPNGVVSNNAPVLRSVNHVLEIDVALAIKKHHMLRMVYAKSLTLAGLPEEDDDPENARFSDLLSGSGGNEAIKLGWTSEIIKTRTRVEVEGKSTDPFFQSYGLGFIRTDSRSVGLRVDQRFGKRFRLRGRGAHEVRGTTSDLNPGTIQIERAQLFANYKVSRSVNVRASITPLVIRTTFSHVPALRNVNNTYNLGFDLRQRFGKTVMRMNLDEGVYTWTVPNESSKYVENHNIGLGFEHGEKWRFHISWTGLSNLSVDSIAAKESVGIQLGFRSKKKFSLQGGIRFTAESSATWLLQLDQDLSKHISLMLKGERFAFNNNYFLTGVDYEHLTNYNCAFAIRYQW